MNKPLWIALCMSAGLIPTAVFSQTIYKCNDPSGTLSYSSASLPGMSCTKIPSRADQLETYKKLIGRPSQDAITMLGKPDKISRSTTATGTSEKWAYAKDVVIVFNGKVKEILSED